MNPGTKVRTRVRIVGTGWDVPAGATGTVTGTFPQNVRPVVVELDGRPFHTSFAPDELEIIE